MSLTLNDPTLDVLPSVFCGDLLIYIVAIYCHLRNDFSSKYESSMVIFHHKLLIREGKIFGQWMTSSIIHDHTRSLTHKKCHPKSYNSDIKYLMTLIIIFSVVYIGLPSLNTEYFQDSKYMDTSPKHGTTWCIQWSKYHPKISIVFYILAFGGPMTSN